MSHSAYFTGGNRLHSMKSVNFFLSVNRKCLEKNISEIHHGHFAIGATCSRISSRSFFSAIDDWWDALVARACESGVCFCFLGDTTCGAQCAHLCIFVVVVVTYQIRKLVPPLPPSSLLALRRKTYVIFVVVVVTYQIRKLVPPHPLSFSPSTQKKDLCYFRSSSSDLPNTKIGPPPPPLLLS